MTTNGSLSQKKFTVENLDMDTKHLLKVWKTRDGKEAPDATPFTLNLGSSLDRDVKDADGKLLPQPVQIVPEWAVAALRKRFGVFNHWEAKRNIVIHPVQ